jgi:predicted nucleic acid-binding protein
VQPFRQRLEAAQLTGLLKLIWVTRETDARAWDVFEQFSDQVLSFADCSSIAICRAEGIDMAFSFDRHFPIAGITKVPGG